MSKDFFKRITVAVNGSQSSIHVAMYAILMAKSYNLKVKVVYVVDTATIKYLSMNKFLIAEEKEDYEHKFMEDGQKYLKYVENLAFSKGLKIETEIRSGGVYSEIIHAAEEFNSDLILLGGHENKKQIGTKNVISHAQNEIILNSSIPVLVVRKPEIERLFKTV